MVKRAKRRASGYEPVTRRGAAVIGLPCRPFCSLAEIEPCSPGLDSPHTPGSDSWESATQPRADAAIEACGGLDEAVELQRGLFVALIAYVNRASDLAYVLARRAGDGCDEPLSPE